MILILYSTKFLKQNTFQIARFFKQKQSQGDMLGKAS